MVTERFAPSPTGLLHLGHAYSAYQAWSTARLAGGRFLIRLEDLDRARTRPEYVEAIFEDLAWLGLDWDEPVLRQSTRGEAYREALEQLASMDLTYRCTCTRRDIAEALAAPHERPAAGPDGPVYPGTCRGATHEADQPHAVRLNVGRAIEVLGGPEVVTRLSFMEIGSGEAGETGRIMLDPDALIEQAGDIVLSRRDGAVAYHLAVVVDDAFQQISHVTRGRDLFEATPIHRVLQALLRLPVPTYRHHRLIRDETGKRLAKRDDARAIATYRAHGYSADAVLNMVGISDQSRLAAQLSRPHRPHAQ